jgi:hypothetical protein
MPMRLNGHGYELKEPDFASGKKPLYNLDRIASNPDAVVWITEGEKAADVLTKLGATVTTSGGANSANDADWSPLAGRTCILWPDNDESGRNYVGEVAAILAAMNCRLSCVDVDTLDLPPKGDAVEWLQSHENATLSDLEALPLLRYQPGEKNAIAADLAGVELQRGDAIEPRPVRWLWRGFLAAGKLHILAGAPGTGKTTVALALAATITVGGRWPDGTYAEPGDVLIWSGEDDVADTLIPRLLAAGADRSRVHFARRTTLQTGEVREFDPATDFPMLSVAASQVPDLRMLLLDPVVSVVGKGTDSHKNSEVRVALQPLADFGDRHQCAVFGVSHFSKGTAGRDPVERVTGSLAFGAAPRVVFAAAKLADDEGGGRVIVRAKSNNGPDGGGFRFDLGRVEIAPGIEGQRVLWGEAVEGAAREILATAEQDNEPGSGDAKEFLRDLLEGGPMPAVDVFKSAEANGYSKRQMQRAREAIAEKHKDGMHGGWIWTLPKMPLPAEDVEGATFSSMEPSAPSAPAKMPIPREDAEDASLSNLAPSRLRDEATPSVTPSEVI